MKKMLVVFAFIAFLLAAWPNTVRAQGGFEQVTGDAFTKAVPDHFELEGMHLPVRKANTVMLKNGKGAQVMIGLLDTSGSSMGIRLKYSGMVSTDTKISVCGISLSSGKYGFGLWAPKAPSKVDGKLTIYTEDGDQKGDCAATRDESVKVPMAVTIVKGKTTKLTILNYAVDIQ
jgi:hypothetical protein